MVILLAGAAAASLWVLLWGLDVKGLDALLVSLLILVLAATAHIVAPLFPGTRARKAQPEDPAPFT